MNYAAVKDALSRCERAEKYAKAVADMAKRADREVGEGPGATYRIFKALFNICSYDHPDFEMFFLPADLLVDALKKASERVQGSIEKQLADAKALVKEGFEVDEIGKKSKKQKEE